MDKLERTSFGRDMRNWFVFPKRYRNINHGAFGTTPTSVTLERHAIQARSEATPDAYQRYEQPELLLDARMAFAAALKAPYTNVVLVPNATSGVNAVLRNLIFNPGDTIIHFSTIYGACGKCVQSVCETTLATSVSIPLTYGTKEISPTPDEIVQTFKDTITSLRTQGRNPRIAIFDVITSMPGVRMPYAALTEVCAEEKVLSLVDGAHGLGCTPLNLSELDPDFFVTNAHKWFFTPRSCAVFVVAERVQKLLRTSFPTSHGWEPMPASDDAEVVNGNDVSGSASKPAARMSPLPPAAGEESLFARTFAFTGTLDISSYLAGPAAKRFREVVCGGEDAILEYNARLVREGAAEVANTLGTAVMDDKNGFLSTNNSMANVLLPLRPTKDIASSQTRDLGDEHPEVQLDQQGPVCVNQWIEAQTVKYDTFIPLMWHGGCWWARLSGQVYLAMDDFHFAAKCLGELCQRVEKGEHLAKAP